ncbi:MAG: hypothetical protein NVS9B15_14470 [Acidobacteriaceae bacterium]
MEMRAADPQQQAMRASYLGELRIDSGSRVLEVGCGSGAVARAIAERWPDAQVTGADPSLVLLEHARELGGGHANLSFEEADARSLPFASDSFDAVIFHTVLCHIPRPEEALAEAFRVLTAGGTLAVFDGDYATTTVAVGETDPLQACVEAAVAMLVHDRWLVRRLPSLLIAAGFEMQGVHAFSLVESSEPKYMLTMVDRGADAIVREGRISEELAAALKAEARARIEAGRFFGHIAYTACLARKPR